MAIGLRKEGISPKCGGHYVGGSPWLVQPSGEKGASEVYQGQYVRVELPCSTFWQGRARLRVYLPKPFSRSLHCSASPPCLSSDKGSLLTESVLCVIISYPDFGE